MKKLILLSALLLFACSSDDNDNTNNNNSDEMRNNPFIGIWVNNEIAGQNLTIEFTSDFKFYYSAGSQIGTYTLNGNIATIDLNTSNNSTATVIDATRINWVTIWTKQ